ncbi:hypothetical protein R1sor_002551 [Riccia sorocarpa]|uniref:GDSL esterase/lipase n=1 Tax=Riccia sorocarpa TaxID=122646 RepID=A0ABD3H573_9MARC
MGLERMLRAVLFMVAVAAGVERGMIRPVEASSRSPFSAMIMLGDSTVDVGTNNVLDTLVKCNFPPYGRDLTVNLPRGRFCDGLLTHDYLAEEFGFPYQIAYLSRAGQEDQLLNGVNFASGGSGWLNLTADTYNLNSFGKQIDQLREYKNELIAMVGQSRADYIISNALYLISTGANDYTLGYYSNPMLQEKYTVSQYQQLIRDSQFLYLKDMYDLGARNVLISSTPPIGCLPASITLYGYRGLDNDGCVKDLNEAARTYNADTVRELEPKFQQYFQGAKFVFFDTYSPLYDVFVHPESFGYKESRRGCCGTGLVEVSLLCNEATPGTCEDASKYVFWDSFHPTTGVYRRIKDYLVPLIKEAFDF